VALYVLLYWEHHKDYGRCGDAGEEDPLKAIMSHSTWESCKLKEPIQYTDINKPIDAGLKLSPQNLTSVDQISNINTRADMSRNANIA
jgi:hypothetical protein